MDKDEKNNLLIGAGIAIILASCGLLLPLGIIGCLIWYVNKDGAIKPGSGQNNSGEQSPRGPLQPW